jgi:hypothetical protein
MVDQVHFELIGLDSWNFEIRNRQHDSTTHHSTAKTAFEGQFNVSEWDQVQEKFQSILKKGQRRVGDERSATNKTSHQKTPAWIACMFILIIDVWRAAISGEKKRIELDTEPTGDNSFSTKGGWTDVGLHSGGLPKDTAWPLVKIAFGFVLGNFLLLEKALLWLDLTLAVHYGKGLDSVQMDEIEVVYNILDSVIVEATKFAAPNVQYQYNMSKINQEATSLRDDLSKLIEKNCEFTHQKYQMDLDKEYEIAHQFAGMAPPKKLIGTTNIATKEEIETKVWNNISITIPFVAPKTHQFSALLKYMDSQNTRNILLTMNIIQDFFFEQSKSLIGTDLVPLSEANSIQILVKKYNTVLSKWLETKESNYLMKTKYKSSLVLMCWIAMCLVHKSSIDVHPLLNEYQIPNLYSELAILVLDLKNASDAVLAVSNYIECQNKKKKAALFGGGSQESTLSFSTLFARNDEKMLDILVQEKKFAKIRTIKRWDVILEKKRALKVLREELKHLKANELTLLNSYNAIKSSYETEYRRNADYITEYERSLDKQSKEAYSLFVSAKNNVESKNSQINNTKKAPPFITNPLPSNDDLAFPVVFFLNCPDLIRIYGELSFLAQEVLLLGKKMPWKTTCTSPWRIYYELHDGNFGCKPFEVTLHPNMKIPNAKGSENVDYISNENDGVFYPDLESEFAWKDSNPFLAKKQEIIKNFTEEAPKGDKVTEEAPKGDKVTEEAPKGDKVAEEAPKGDKVPIDDSWMIDFPVSNRARGNIPFTRQNKRGGFNKENFLTLGSIRSYPNQQLRKIAVAMMDKSLDFENLWTQTVIRQAFYQLGEISRLTPDSSLSFIWKTDLFKDNGVDSFLILLGKLGDSLKNVPSNHQQFPILAEMVSFFGQFGNSKQSRRVIRKYFAMGKAWVDNESTLRKTSEDPNEIHEHLIKETLMLGYSINVYGIRTVDTKIDAMNFLQSVVRFRNCFLLVAQDHPMKKNLDMLLMKVTEASSRNLDQLVKFVEADRATILSSAFLCVKSNLPHNLKWSRMNESCCYTSWHGLDNYSINVFNGFVLINGNPPSTLPLSVRTHHLFLRVFGDVDFQVTTKIRENSKDAFFESTESIGGCFYQFALVGNRLSIIELGEDQLELIDHNIYDDLNDHLPPRLRSMYSHWYSHAENVLFFRPHSFKDKSIFYVLQAKCKTNINCRKVPKSFTSNSWPIIKNRMKEFARIIWTPNSSVIPVLSLFETSTCIELYLTSEGRMLYSLPRFNLEFLLERDTESEEVRLKSLQHNNYQLTSNQRLDNALRGHLLTFQSYLLLSKTKPDIGLFRSRLLVPLGNITKNKSNVKIHLPESNDSSIGLYCYDVHPRLRSIIADSIPSRLKLAAIYATQGILPMLDFNMSGLQYSLYLSIRPQQLVEQESDAQSNCPR